MEISNYGIDSHVHLDRIVEGDPARIDWMMERYLAPVSWAFSEGCESFESVGTYLEGQKDLISRLNRRGLQCFHVVGVHPRCIPPEEGWNSPVEEFLTGLFQYFREDPFCLGVGEIGLETGSDVEIAFLEAHLKAISVFTDACLCVHTPRKNKARVAQAVLEILENADLDPGRIVVDHLTLDTIGPVLERGYWAGVTLSPIKCGPEDVLNMVDRFPGAIGRLMLNTDSNREFYEDFYRFIHSPETPEDWALRLGFENAARFFKITDRF